MNLKKLDFPDHISKVNSEVIENSCKIFFENIELLKEIGFKVETGDSNYYKILTFLIEAQRLILSYSGNNITYEGNKLLMIEHALGDIEGKFKNIDIKSNFQRSNPKRS